MVLFHSFCSRYISSASSSNISSLDRLTATCTQDITAVMTVTSVYVVKKTLRNYQKSIWLSVRLGKKKK